MNNYCNIKSEKIKSKAALTSAQKHNSRTYDVSNANSELTHQNKSYIDGSAAENFEKLSKEHNLKIRKNAVVAIEVLCTFSPDMKGKIDLDKWAKDSIEFTAKRYGGKRNLLSADLHVDESTPHLHITLAPLVTKYSKRKKREVTTLSARDLIGGSDSVMSQLQTDYAEAMKPHGLVRGIEKSTRENRGEVVDYKDISEFYKEIAEDKAKVISVVKDLKKDLAEIQDTQKLNLPKRMKLLESLTAKFQKIASNLAGDNRRLRKDKNKASDKIKHTQKKLSEARRELKDISAQLSSLKSELARSEQDRAIAEQELRTIQMESNPSQELRDEVAFLRQQNHHLKTKRSNELEK